MSAGARTPIGEFNGSLAGFSSIDLGVIALKGALEKAGVDPGLIEEVVAGHCLQAGDPGNTARHVTIRAGLPASTVSMTVNQQCPSSMRATEVIAQEIALGKIDIGAAVGIESMTNAPYLLLKARFGYRMGHGELLDSMLYNGLFCGFVNYPYGDHRRERGGDVRHHPPGAGRTGALEPPTGGRGHQGREIQGGDRPGRG